MKVVVLGNGMAGARFVQELLTRTDEHEITIVGDEAGGAYNRMQLSNVLAGRAAAHTIDLATPDWYAERGVDLRGGRTALRIDRATQCVRLDDGSTVPYDELVLATGSEPVLPPVAGLVTDAGLLPGSVLFRTFDDCRQIDRRARTARHAVVLGGGVLGVEAARALSGRDLTVTIVQRGPRLMERQLDADAARTLRRSLAALGITVSTRRALAAVTGSDRVDGVELDDGSTLDCDLLVVCCGVRPRVGLARDAGLPVAHGVLVDDELRSIAEPAIRAIGECAEHRGRTHGLVAPTWEQARVAAVSISTPAAGVRYGGSNPVTRLKAEGLEVAALGDPLAEDDDLEIVRFSDSGRGVYQKLVIRDDRLVGAVLVGDTRAVGTVVQFFDRGTVLPHERAGLLMVRRNAPATAVTTPITLPAQATICQCNGVTKAAITSAWQDGAGTVEEVALRTRATTGCGTCRDAVCGLVDWLASSA